MTWLKSHEPERTITCDGRPGRYIHIWVTLLISHPFLIRIPYQSLSKNANESLLLEAIQARRHGDALYFWVLMDKHPRNPLSYGFWSFCDVLNARNCRYFTRDLSLLTILIVFNGVYNQVLNVSFNIV